MLCDFEGFRSKPYRDTGGVYTIGYGATYDKNGNKVTKNTPQMSKTDARALLDLNVAQFSAYVDLKVTVSLTQNQFDACVLLSYNIGMGGFQKSQLLKNINAGNKILAENFYSWNKDRTGKVVPGLVARRKKEYALFLKQ